MVGVSGWVKFGGRWLARSISKPKPKMNMVCRVYGLYWGSGNLCGRVWMHLVRMSTVMGSLESGRVGRVR